MSEQTQKQKTERKNLREQVEELTEIEFDSGSDIHKYAEKVRNLQKSLALEVEYAAQELEARLKELPPPPQEGPAAAKRKAKAVARHLKRSAEGARRSGIEAVRTWASLRRHYEHIFEPEKAKKKKTLDLTL